MIQSYSGHRLKADTVSGVIVRIADLVKLLTDSYAEPEEIVRILGKDLPPVLEILGDRAPESALLEITRITSLLRRVVSPPDLFPKGILPIVEALGDQANTSTLAGVAEILALSKDIKQTKEMLFGSTLIPIIEALGDQVEDALPEVAEIVKQSEVLGEETSGVLSLLHPIIKTFDKRAKDALPEVKLVVRKIKNTGVFRYGLCPAITTLGDRCEVEEIKDIGYEVGLIADAIAREIKNEREMIEVFQYGIAPKIRALGENFKISRLEKIGSWSISTSKTYGLLHVIAEGGTEIIKALDSRNLLNQDTLSAVEGIVVGGQHNIVDEEHCVRMLRASLFPIIKALGNQANADALSKVLEIVKFERGFHQRETLLNEGLLPVIKALGDQANTSTLSEVARTLELATRDNIYKNEYKNKSNIEVLREGLLPIIKALGDQVNAGALSEAITIVKLLSEKTGYAYPQTLSMREFCRDFLPKIIRKLGCQANVETLSAIREIVELSRVSKKEDYDRAIRSRLYEKNEVVEALRFFPGIIEALGDQATAKTLLKVKNIAKLAREQEGNLNFWGRVVFGESTMVKILGLLPEMLKASGNQNSLKTLLAVEMILRLNYRGQYDSTMVSLCRNGLLPVVKALGDQVNACTLSAVIGLLKLSCYRQEGKYLALNDESVKVAVKALCEGLLPIIKALEDQFTLPQIVDGVISIVVQVAEEEGLRGEGFLFLFNRVLSKVKKDPEGLKRALTNTNTMTIVRKDAQFAKAYVAKKQREREQRIRDSRGRHSTTL